MIIILLFLFAPGVASDKCGISRRIDSLNFSPIHTNHPREIPELQFPKEGGVGIGVSHRSVRMVRIVQKAVLVLQRARTNDLNERHAHYHEMEKIARIQGSTVTQ